MDETSCHEVEEEDCGVCHTIYMPDCEMKMVEEMMPSKVNMCKNITKYEDKCETTIETKEIEVRTPLCKVKLMDKHHMICTDDGDKDNCKKMMKCQLTTKMKKKQIPTIICKKVAMKEKEEKCFDMVHLNKEMHAKKICSFHPKTICHDSQGKECRKVKKMMCNYLDSNQL